MSEYNLRQKTYKERIIMPNNDNNNDAGVWRPVSAIQKLARKLTDRRNRRKQKPEKVGKAQKSQSETVDKTINASSDNAFAFHEKLVKTAMESFLSDGWEPVLADQTGREYDMMLCKEDERIAVQVRSQKIKIGSLIW